jgi:dTDP-4-dehydrorhamnose reductase
MRTRRVVVNRGLTLIPGDRLLSVSGAVRPSSDTGGIVMKVLLTGGTGQVGRMMRARAPASIRIVAPPRAELDLTRPQSIADSLDHRPDVVVNTAAFTAVDRAEETPEAAFAVNGEGASILARGCAERNIPLIHLSTDYVFDGRKPEPYTESDPPNPLNVYGRSKLEGEAAVRGAGGRHVILRCSWVFGPHGANFVRSILTRAARGGDLRVVDDQRGCPTATTSIADAVFAVARRITAGGDVPWGTYHCAGREAVTWFEFALAVIEDARRWLPRIPRIEPISTAQFGARALRPANSVLDCTLLAQRFGVAAQSWRPPLSESVARIGAELASSITPVDGT